MEFTRCLMLRMPCGRNRAMNNSYGTKFRGSVLKPSTPQLRANPVIPRASMFKPYFSGYCLVSAYQEITGLITFQYGLHMGCPPRLAWLKSHHSRSQKKIPVGFDDRYVHPDHMSQPLERSWESLAALTSGFRKALLGFGFPVP